MMRKVTFFIAAVLAMGFIAKAQDVLVVKDGFIEVWDHINYQFYYDSYFEMPPTNFYVAHTGAQLLYTPDLLSDMNGKHNVEITEIGFRLHNKAFDAINRVVMIYLQEVDATEFAENEAGVKQFFDFDHVAMADLYHVDLSDCYSQDLDMNFTVSMNGPFYFTPGKSLLVTIVFDALDDGNTVPNSYDVTFYKSCMGSGKAMTYTDNWTSFVDYAKSSDFPNATAMHGCGTDLDLPWTRIWYCYTEGGTSNLSGDVDGDDVVSISDVAVLVDFLLNGNADGVILDNADCDHDGEIGIADVSVLIDSLLNGSN